jgi:acyl dehydratase
MEGLAAGRPRGGAFLSVEPSVSYASSLAYFLTSIPLVRPGDALDLEMTILELRPSKSKPDWGIVRNQNLLRNQKRETVLECISTIFVARRPDANASPP